MAGLSCELSRLVTTIKQVDGYLWPSSIADGNSGNARPHMPALRILSVKQIKCPGNYWNTTPIEGGMHRASGRGAKPMTQFAQCTCATEFLGKHTENLSSQSAPSRTLFLYIFFSLFVSSNICLPFSLLLCCVCALVLALFDCPYWSADCRGDFQFELWLLYVGKIK